MRCKACHRPLSDPVSIKHGFGPDCLKKAVAAGQAPLESLTELSAFQRTQRKARKTAKPAPRPVPVKTDQHTGDLFDPLKTAALEDLDKAVSALQALGVHVEVTIHDHRPSNPQTAPR